MGAFLDKPKTEKTEVSGEGSNGLRYGVSAMQGWRMEMEDAHVCNTDFGFKDCAFFGVFDGHAGSKVSKHCAESLLSSICDKIEKDKNEADVLNTEHAKKGILEGFLALDENMRSDQSSSASGEDRSGTTAITVMVSPDHIIWGNCGDSRGLLCRNGKIEFATEDHKPYNADEKSRIERAGGTVMMQRVNGSLAVSRALGDFDYKRSTDLKPVEQLVSPEPDISVNNREDTDEFLFLACDGIFDVMTNDEVVKYILHQLTLKENLAEICSSLLDLCLHKNSRDNMSAILVTFPNAPKVSQEAIEKNEVVQAEAKKEIEKKLIELVEGARDSLDLDESSVMQQLLTSLPDECEVVSKRPWIAEQLQVLRKEKFNDPLDDLPDNTDSMNPLFEPGRGNDAGVFEQQPSAELNRFDEENKEKDKEANLEDSSN